MRERDCMGVAKMGARIRIARQALRDARGRRLTQHDLGVVVGVAGNTLSEWERGRAPVVTLLPALAHALDVGLTWLLTGEAAGTEGPRHWRRG